MNSNDFSAKTVKKLAAKGVTILGATAVPGFDGDKYFSGTAYRLSYNDGGFIRTHSQVLAMANSSWMPQGGI